YVSTTGYLLPTHATPSPLSKNYPVYPINLCSFHHPSLQSPLPPPRFPHPPHHVSSPFCLSMFVFPVETYDHTSLRRDIFSLHTQHIPPFPKIIPVYPINLCSFHHPSLQSPLPPPQFPYSPHHVSAPSCLSMFIQPSIHCNFCCPLPLPHHVSAPSCLSMFLWHNPHHCTNTHHPQVRYNRHVS
ncbi:MAG: hypothetical protein RL076_2324, partial [Chloroflexota bacterium]